jgi:hypothetical protein
MPLSELKAGDIVRYDDGVSALMRLLSPHAGGWHGEHVLGGIHFSSNNWQFRLQAASEKDIEFCKQHKPEWFKTEIRMAILSQADEELQKEARQEAELFTQALEEFIRALMEEDRPQTSWQERDRVRFDLEVKRTAFVDALLKSLS